jgi:hypothetical protein
MSDSRKPIMFDIVYIMVGYSISVAVEINQ